MSLVQDAVGFVAKLLPDKDIDPLIDARRVVGQPLSRLDAPAKVTGTAQYTADYSPPNLAHATLVCSRIAAGTIVDFDTTQAEAAPGVLLVLTHRNAPKMGKAPLLMDFKGASFTQQPVMQDAHVRWNGEPVAVVVAQTKVQADHAAKLVRISYDAAAPRLEFERLKEEARQPKDVFTQPSEIVDGDAEVALSAAGAKVDNTYRTPWHNHAAIELHACLAEWDGEDRVTLYDATQAVTLTRSTLAKVFDLKEANVRVICQYVGGGFGNKMAWNHQLLCVAAARMVARPVRLMLSRADTFLTLGGRTLTQQRVALGASADGALTALIHTGVTTTGIDNGFPEQFSFPARHLYRSDTRHIEQRLVELNTAANSSMRAPGESVGGYALESAIDELAHALNLDPIELRRRNQPATDPSEGTPFSSRNLMEALDRGAAAFGWAQRKVTPRSTRDGDWFVGHGMACAFYPYQRFPGAEVKLRLTADGRVIIKNAAQEMGMGTATAQTQLAAERLGLPVDKVQFVYGDSELPSGIPAAGSAQTVSIVAAVTPASEALFKKLLKLVDDESPLAGKRLDEIEARDEGLYLRNGGPGESYVALLTRAGKRYIESKGKGGLPLEMMKYSMHSYGGQFCEVRVNEITGEVRITRWLGAFDTGRIINPKTAASQFRGGIVMGIGSALTEQALFDERYGRIVNRSMAEYHVPVHADIPAIDVLWLDSPDPLAPMGAKGVGEIGITGVAAAVANAVFNATGRRIRELPLTPDKLLTAPVAPTALRAS